VCIPILQRLGVIFFYKSNKAPNIEKWIFISIIKIHIDTSVSKVRHLFLNRGSTSYVAPR
jgi:hypothetical protein